MTTNTGLTEPKSPSEEHPTSMHSGHGAPPYQPPKPGQKAKKRGLVWVLLMLVVVGVAAYAVWRASKPGLVPPNPNGGGRRGAGRGAAAFGPTPVGITAAAKRAVPVYLTGLGNVQAYYTVSVKSRVDGQLMSINFKEGDVVKQGDALAEIDPRPFQVQLEQAEGTLARDTALLSNARIDLTRYETLLAQDAIPRQQLDTQRATVSQLEGTIKQDTAAINNAKLQLTYSRITAPISGRIGLRLVDPGNIVRAGDAGGMLVITQLQPISVLFTIPEDSLPQVMTKLNHGVKLTVEAWNRDNSTKIATGVLVTADNQIDQTTGTSRMKATFANKDGALFPNQFVNVRLLVDTMKDQVVVPSVAIQHGQQGQFVFVVTPGEQSRVRITPVTAGIVLDDNTTAILSGLEGGEQVVTDGTDRLQNDTPVRVRRPEDITGPGGGRPRGRGARGRNGGAAGVGNREAGGRQGGGPRAGGQ